MWKQETSKLKTKSKCYEVLEKQNTFILWNLVSKFSVEIIWILGTFQLIDTAHASTEYIING